MKLIRLVVVFAVGYVLGAQAGRRRYDQIRDIATRVGDDPRVQEAAGKAEALVREALHTLTDAEDGTGAAPAGHSSTRGSTWPEHPDAHVEVPQDEVVYSAGPAGR
ncbi:hypothetical protein [Aeromicrobium sp. CTD01-1L150]|uniref:hypothetical protein n=1 Tax=Aeromicrobium sp. CTD01-1L150 TaxID=3341830 RepID=UPI0035C1817C